METRIIASCLLSENDDETAIDMLAFRFVSGIG